MSMRYRLWWLGLALLALGFFGPIVWAGTPPLPPTDLTAIPKDSEVELRWEPPLGDFSGVYRIYNALPGGPFGNLATVPYGTTRFTVSGLYNGVTYLFYVTAVNSTGEESSPSATVSATPYTPDWPGFTRMTSSPEGLLLRWRLPEQLAFSGISIYTSTISSNGPWAPAASVEVTVTTHSLTWPANGQSLYLRLTGHSTEGYGEVQIDSGRAMPYNGFGFAESEREFFVRYDSYDKPVDYILHKFTRPGSDGLYQQFAHSMLLNGTPVSLPPYSGGLAGLVLLSMGGGNEISPPLFEGSATWGSSEGVILRYTPVSAWSDARIDALSIDLKFSAHNPYLEIIMEATSPVLPSADSGHQAYHFSWNVFATPGGSYDPKNRVVVPYDVNRYYVINGQALGVHYFARGRSWGLRMGAAGTPGANVTMGFFSADGQTASVVNGWPMAHDYWTGGSTPPLELASVYDSLYINYQEDEAGNGIEHGYSWQNADTVNWGEVMAASRHYRSSLYYWIGEDHFSGSYGINSDAIYQFRIAQHQASLPRNHAFIPIVVKGSIDP